MVLLFVKIGLDIFVRPERPAPKGFGVTVGGQTDDQAIDHSRQGRQVFGCVELRIWND